MTQNTPSPSSQSFKMSNRAICILAFLAISNHGLAAETLPGKTIFHDDFERSESNEKREDVGNGWKTNSKSRAQGNKQVDLKDGGLFIKMHAAADHAVSVVHEAGFRDGGVETRFMLNHPKDNLGLNFADLTFKPVHAGHLFVVRIGEKQIQIDDLKTGKMKKEIREARLKKTGISRNPSNAVQENETRQASH